MQAISFLISYTIIQIANSDQNWAIFENHSTRWNDFDAIEFLHGLLT